MLVRKIIVKVYFCTFAIFISNQELHFCYVALCKFVSKLPGDQKKSTPQKEKPTALRLCIIAQKMKFSIQDFFSKCDRIRTKLRIWSHLLKKSLMENLMFCAVYVCETCLQIYEADHSHIKEKEINSLYSDSVELYSDSVEIYKLC